jgi:hypothetical protein
LPLAEQEWEMGGWGRPVVLVGAALAFMGGVQCFAPPRGALSLGRAAGQREGAMASRRTVLMAGGADGASGGGKPKKVVVLGGDGFCGWPTSLYLSERGHDVIVVDNLSRRNIDNELGCSSLTPITSMDTRVKTWNGINSREIRFVNLDVARDYEELVQVCHSPFLPTVMHFIITEAGGEPCVWPVGGY